MNVSATGGRWWPHTCPVVIRLLALSSSQEWGPRQLDSLGRGGCDETRGTWPRAHTLFTGQEFPPWKQGVLILVEWTPKMFGPQSLKSVNMSL